MPITFIEVKKNNNENNASLMRRFSRRVQEGGALPKVKSKRYSKKTESSLSRKTMALRRMSRAAEVDKLKKLGKFVEKKKGKR